MMVASAEGMPTRIIRFKEVKDPGAFFRQMGISIPLCIQTSLAEAQVTV